MMSPKWRHN